MLLAIDTSTSTMGLALHDGDRVLAEMTWTSGQHHTTQLSPALSDLLKRCGVPMSKVSALGVAIGPGSFTSLRVGLSLVKGLALARSLPVMGISTLDVIAAAQPAAAAPLVSVLQAGRKRIAFGVYHMLENQWQAQGAVRSGTLLEMLAQLDGETLIAGELTAEERNILSKEKHLRLSPPSLCVRRPAVLAELAWARWLDQDADDAASLAPIYLHVAGTPIQ